jgi:DNA polymerase-4
LSLDEAFVDVTGEERLFGDGPTIARKIKEDVRAEVELVASVGVAPCKFVAKIATDLGKPDGLKVVEPGDVLRFLHPLPVARLWGVGRATEEVLAELSVRTIGDVARLDERILAAKLGPAHAAHLKARASGIDDRRVDPERAPVSLGHENTFDRDLYARPELLREILAQADETCARLRKEGLRGRIVTLKVKYADHQLVTRRRTLDAATADSREVGQLACALLAEVPEVERRGVRLTGVSLSGLVGQAHTGQLDFAAPARARGEKLGATIDRINEKFGSARVKRAIHLDDED